MSEFFAEANYENSIIELFQNMNYRHIYGVDVDKDFHNPLYENKLTNALYHEKKGFRVSERTLMYDRR